MTLTNRILLATIFIVPICYGQGHLGTEDKQNRPQRPRGPKPRLVPFHKISKEAGFEILQADKASFIEMESLILTVGKSINPKLPKDINVVQLTYGYKKGGISCVYLTPKIGKLTAEEVLKPLVDGKVLKDRQYFKDWSIASVPNAKLLVMVSGTTPEVRATMSKSLR